MYAKENKSLIAEALKLLEPLTEALKLLKPLTEAEKKQAIAFIQGINIGKELAEQKESA